MNTKLTGVCDQRFPRQKINSSQIKVCHFQWTPNLKVLNATLNRIYNTLFFVCNSKMITMCYRNKHPYQSLRFKKAAGQRPATLLKNRSRYRSSPATPSKTPRTITSTEHLRWLLSNRLKKW